MKTMRRITLVIALPILLVFLACSNSANDQNTTRKFLSFGTAPPGGSFFVVGSALSEVVNEFGAVHAFNATAEATSGSQENIRRLASGELDFALSNSAITYFAVRGTEGWNQEYQMQSVMTLAPNVTLFIAPAGSGIETLDDLRGRRVSVGPAGAGFEYFIRPLLEAHGLTYDDFSPLNATQQAAVDMLSDGSADAAFLGGAIPTASITQASASMDIVFLPYQETAKQALINDYVFFQEATIPAGTYGNQTEAFDGLDVGSMHLITNTNAPSDLVYEITRLLYENRDRVSEKHAAGRSINPTNVVRNIGTTFHQGAIRFYREIGIWPE